MRFSAKQLEAFEAFSEDVEHLEQACGALKHSLDEAWRRRRVDARVFELPRIESDHGPPPSLITPHRHSDRAAYQLARNALTDWYAVPGFATKAVHRTPGVLCVNTDSAQMTEELEGHVAQVNRIKTRLRGHSKAMGDPDKRHELIHRRFYMMMLAQLTRALTLVRCPPDLRSITFSWGFKTEIRRIDVEQACQILEQMRPLLAIKAARTQQPWINQVTQEQARLRSLPSDTPLRWRRPLPARPLANLRWEFSDEQLRARREAREQGEKVESPTFMREAHTPILILNPTAGFRIGTLGIFDLDERVDRQARNDRLSESDPVTPLAPIYRIKE